MSSNSEDEHPELVILDKTLKTKRQYYTHLQKIYFLPAYTSKAITSQSLVNLLKKSDQYLCPFDRDITRLRTYHPSNYSLKQIHFVANILAYQEGSRVLFFKEHADWRYYQILIRSWNEKIFNTVYQYKYLKSSTLTVTETFNGYLFQPSFKKNSMLRRKILAINNDGEGNTFRIEKANVEAKLMNKPIGLKIQDGTKTYYENSEAYLYTLLHNISQELENVEDAYSNLKKEFTKNSKIYHLQRELLKLRIDIKVWNTIENYIPQPSEEEIFNLLKEDHLIRVAEPETYDSAACKLGVQVEFDNLKNYWSKINTEINIEHFLAANPNLLANNADFNVKANKLAFIADCKRLNNIEARNNIAKLLINPHQTELEITKNDGKCSDKYYDVINKLTSAFISASPSLNTLINGTIRNLSLYKQKQTPINFIDVVLDSCLFNESVDIDIIRDDIIRAFKNRVTGIDIEINIWYQTQICRENWKTERSKKNTCAQIIFLFLLRRGVIELMVRTKPTQNILSNIFELTSAAVNFSYLTSYQSILKLQINNEYLDNPNYITVLQEFEARHIPLSAQIYLFITFIRHIEGLDAYLQNNYQQLATFCNRTVNYYNNLIENGYSSLEADLFSITGPRDKSLQVLKNLPIYNLLQEVMIQLFCKAQIQWESIYIQVIYKIMHEVIKQASYYNISAAFIEGVIAAFNSDKDYENIIKILQLVFTEQRTKVTHRNLTIHDFEDCNLLLVLITLVKIPVSMPKEWENTIRTLVTYLVSDAADAQTILNNIVIKEDSSIESLNLILGYKE